MGEPRNEDYEAAERLVREAHARAEEAARAGAGAVPPNGWATPGDEPRHSPGPLPDLGMLLRLVDCARGTLPPELARPLADALRELLIALRAIIDYGIARLERHEDAEPRVEDIPVQ
jgi:hypothetical protein